jgi:hypothetical protein
MVVCATTDDATIRISPAGATAAIHRPFRMRSLLGLDGRSTCRKANNRTSPCDFEQD